MFGAKSVFILSYEFSKCDMVHNSYTVIHDVYRTKEEANRMIESLKLQLDKQIPVTYHIKHCLLDNLEPENNDYLMAEIVKKTMLKHEDHPDYRLDPEFIDKLNEQLRNEFNVKKKEKENEIEELRNELRENLIKISNDFYKFMD